MRTELSRSAFLRQAATGWRPPVRPPWSLTEEEFLRSCTRCEDCRDACPEQILTRDKNGYPTTSFTNGECTFCGDCLQACNSNAITGDPDEDTPWSLKAIIKDNCLSMQSITCRVCSDQCDARAISFELKPGGKAPPLIDSEACTGCGACIAPCPVAAISCLNDSPIIMASTTSFSGEHRI